MPTHLARRRLGMLAPTPFNTFGHAPQLAGPTDDFVSVNNDTVLRDRRPL